MILASKMLQCLANGTELKEVFMLPLNAWLAQSQPALESFFLKVTKEPVLEVGLFKPALKYTETKESNLSTLHSAIKAKDLVHQIPSSLDVNVDGIARIRVVHLLQAVLDHLRGQHQQGHFDTAADPVVNLFAQLVAQDALIASMAEKAEEIIPYQQKEAFAGSVLTVFGWIYPEKTYVMLIYWLDVEIDTRGAAMNNSIISQMVTCYIRMVNIKVASHLLGGLIERIVTHSVHAEASSTV
jgi:hypothetical protein